MNVTMALICTDLLCPRRKELEGEKRLPRLGGLIHLVHDFHGDGLVDESSTAKIYSC
jgi:hypothetical protein